MRILFLTQVLPFPLDAGPKVRAYYTLRHLAANHQVTLVSFVRPSDGSDDVAHLGEWCEQVVTIPMSRSRWHDLWALWRSVLNGRPFLITRDWVAAMGQELRRLVKGKHFDVIHADQLWMAPYALAAQKWAVGAGYQPKLILDQHNAVYLIPQRMATAATNPVIRAGLKWEAGRMARYEADTCLKFDQVVTVTQEDQDTLTALYDQPERPSFSTVIPICGDPQSVRPVDPLQGDSILFFGGMHWPPNADGISWFSEEILPAIWQASPAASLLAVGKEPPTALGQMGERVIAPGYVDDPEPYWQGSRLFIVPLRAGGGMRVKIIDAWTRGLPVVSTTVGAEGIAACDGKNILLADTAEAFAQAVVRVLCDNELAARLAANGRKTVLDCYDWRKVYRAWDGVYHAL
jgi:glycosyltransferase involved in cell wall biosynthesis